MTKNEIKQNLIDRHSQFINHLKGLSDKDFLKSVNEKWTPGQQLDHILKSVAPVNLALSLPKFLLRLVFGRANRPSRTYEELVEKYQLKLAQGGKAPSRFIPNPVLVGERAILSKKLQSLIELVVDRVDNFSEKQLDHYVLPHPLLGKITIREMLLFTIYHVGHHEKQVIVNLTFLQPSA